MPQCKIPNHSQRDCWFKDNKSKIKAHITKAIDGNKVFFSYMSVQQDSNKIWHLDSVCSCHMIGNKNLFFKIDKNYFVQVKIRDGKLCEVKGK